MVEDQNSKFYNINDSFIAVVNGDQIRVGNPTILAMPCVHMEASDKDKTIYLQGLSHHESCNISNNMPHGEQCTILMLNLALSFAKHLKPMCTKLHLQDTSGYHDQRIGSVDLSTKSMLSYRQTWYQLQLSRMNVKLRPATKLGKSVLNKYLEVLDLKPSHQVCKELNIPKSETIFDAVQHISEPKYLSKMKICQFYGLPSLFGLEWTGSIKKMKEIEDLKYIQISKPRHLKAQWGGRELALDSHLYNVVL